MYDTLNSGRVSAARVSAIGVSPALSVDATVERVCAKRNRRYPKPKFFYLTLRRNRIAENSRLAVVCLRRIL